MKYPIIPRWSEIPIEQRMKWLRVKDGDGRYLMCGIRDGGDLGPLHGAIPHWAPTIEDPAGNPDGVYPVFYGWDSMDAENQNLILELQDADGVPLWAYKRHPVLGPLHPGQPPVYADPACVRIV